MKIGLVLLLGILSCPVQAKVIFSCTTTEGKLLEITRHGTEYQYLFGSRSKPELVFRNGRRQVYEQSGRWTGLGRSMWVGMTLKNHSYHYFVWSSSDRLFNEHDELHQEAGLTVSGIRKVDHDPLPQKKQWPI